jgi:hypothetical protein
MSKQQERIGRAAQKTKQMLGRHVGELVGHTLEAASYNAHGHAEEARSSWAPDAEE